MSDPQLAISVVNWNVQDLLAECLRSAQQAVAAAGLSAEVWVVDNASRDGSVQMLREQFPGVHLIASPLNLGFGGGHNLVLSALGFGTVPVPEGAGALLADVESKTGPRSSVPRYVLILNPDTRVRRDALGALVRVMDREARVGVCGPRLVYGDGSFQHAAYRFPSLAQIALDFWPINWRLTESRLNGRYPRRLYEGAEPFPIDHPLGAAMLLRREAVAETGGFDPDYHMYVEEIDWCMRLKQAGWAIVCVPGAEIVHYEGQSTRQVRPQMVTALWRSRHVLFAKHYSPLFQWTARRLIRAGMITKVRRTRREASEGSLDADTAQDLIGAYRRVAAM